METYIWDHMVDREDQQTNEHPSPRGRRMIELGGRLLCEGGERPNREVGSSVREDDFQKRKASSSVREDSIHMCKLEFLREQDRVTR